jgi:hypothetical protein
MLPLGLTLVASLVLAGGLLWLNRISTVSANTSDFSLAESTYPTIVGSRIDNCSLCHSSVPSLNAYGAAYKAGGRGIASSLTGIANADSDGDGFTNIQEINAHTYPGNALDFPAVATATATLTATYPPPTATPVGPTATQPAPTATQTGPTATKPAPTATLIRPTATLGGPTATLNPKMTRTPKATRTPEVSPTRRTSVTPRASVTPGGCVKDDDDYREREKIRERIEGKKRHNECPPDFHDRGDDGSIKGDRSFLFTQVLNTVNHWFTKFRP